MNSTLAYRFCLQPALHVQTSLLIDKLNFSYAKIALHPVAGGAAAPGAASSNNSRIPPLGLEVLTSGRAPAHLPCTFLFHSAPFSEDVGYGYIHDVNIIWQTQQDEKRRDGLLRCRGYYSKS